jgi:hypothetical protein
MEDRNDSSAASAGWYPDPEGRHQYRYWDGHILDGQIQAAETVLSHWRDRPARRAVG